MQDPSCLPAFLCPLTCKDVHRINMGNFLSLHQPPYVVSKTHYHRDGRLFIAVSQMIVMYDIFSVLMDSSLSQAQGILFRVDPEAFTGAPFFDEHLRRQQRTNPAVGRDERNVLKLKVKALSLKYYFDYFYALKSNTL